jgi:hypothetical protein
MIRLNGQLNIITSIIHTTDMNLIRNICIVALKQNGVANAIRADRYVFNTEITATAATCRGNMEIITLHLHLS